MRNRLFPLLACLLAACLAAQVPAAEETSPAVPSMTIYPVGLGTTEPAPKAACVKVASVLGLFFERSGVESLDLPEVGPQPSGTTPLESVSDAVVQFVTAHPIKTDVALYAQFLGTPGVGVDAVRCVVVDRQGTVVLATEDDADSFGEFADPRPQDPMSCCLFTARRAGAHWRLPDPLRPGATEGKLHAQWERESGVPPKEELAAMNARLKELADRVDKADFQVAVLPVRVGDEYRRDVAEQLAARINEEHKPVAIVSAKTATLEIEGNSNEQKVLWDTAKALQTWVKAAKPEGDYVLLADYGIWGGAAHAVHVVVCDAQGRLVLVDYQNSHHADFQELATADPNQCNRLVLRRLAARLGQ